MDKLISIIIPVYNVEKYFNRCIQSVLSQTYKNIEVILVDDGSKDSSGAICDEWGKKDSRIKVFHKENEGASIARNYGIKKSSGDFIQFVDSDDYIDPDFVERLYQPFLENESLDVAIAGFTIERGVDSERHEPEEHRIYTIQEIADIDVFYNLTFVSKFAFLDSPINKLYKRSVVAEFDSHICISEDKAFNIHCLYKIKKFAVVKASGYHYIMAENSLSHSKYPNLHKDLQLVDNILFDYVLSKCVGEVERFIQTVSIETFLRCVRHYLSQSMEVSLIVEKIEEMLKNKYLSESLTKRPRGFKNRVLRCYIKKRKYKEFVILYGRYLKFKKIDLGKI